MTKFNIKTFAKAKFVYGANTYDAIPKTSLPEIAVIGRSNSGKSSLINALTNSKNLAIVSQTPGRTKQLNFFLLDEIFMLVDLPGYGYAKTSKDIALASQDLAWQYLSSRAQLAKLLLLIDARRSIMPIDTLVIDSLNKNRIPFQLIFTKIDKVPENVVEDLKTNQKILPPKFMSTQDGADYETIMSSSRTRDGIGLIRQSILSSVQKWSDRFE